jgi:hypothetical protein
MLGSVETYVYVVKTLPSSDRVESHAEQRAAEMPKKSVLFPRFG